MDHPTSKKQVNSRTWPTAGRAARKTFEVTRWATGKHDADSLTSRKLSVQQSNVRDDSHERIELPKQVSEGHTRSTWPQNALSVDVAVEVSCFAPVSLSAAARLSQEEMSGGRQLLNAVIALRVLTNIYAAICHLADPNEWA